MKKGIIAVELFLIVFIVYAIGVVKSKDAYNGQSLRSISVEAESYELEKAAVERELASREAEVLAQGESFPCAILCFHKWQQTGWNRTVSLMESYGYAGTIIWKDQSEDDVQTAMGTLAEHGWNIMLGGSMAGDAGEWEKSVEKRQTVAEEHNWQLSAFYYLDPSENTNDHLALLKKHHFTGYSQMTDYGLILMSGPDGNGFTAMEHVPVFDGENKIDSSLAMAVEEKKPFILEIGQIGYESPGDLSGDTWNGILELLKTYEESSGLSVLSESGYVQQVNENQKEADKQFHEFQVYQESQQQVIDELKHKIDEIYRKAAQPEEEE